MQPIAVIWNDWVKQILQKINSKAANRFIKHHPFASEICLVSFIKWQNLSTSAQKWTIQTYLLEKFWLQSYMTSWCHCTSVAKWSKVCAYSAFTTKFKSHVGQILVLLVCLLEVRFFITDTPVFFTTPELTYCVDRSKESWKGC